MSRSPALAVRPWTLLALLAVAVIGGELGARGVLEDADLDVVTGRALAPVPGGDKPAGALRVLVFSDAPAGLGPALADGAEREWNVIEIVRQAGSWLDVCVWLDVHGGVLAPDLVVVDLPARPPPGRCTDAWTLAPSGRVRRKIPRVALDDTLGGSRLYTAVRLALHPRPRAGAGPATDAARALARAHGADLVATPRAAAASPFVLDGDGDLAARVRAYVRDRLETIDVDRTFTILPRAASGDLRPSLAAAADGLDGWALDIGGAVVDATVLRELARTPDDAPLTRAARERLRRPVDVEDLLYFLDDLLAAAPGMLFGKPIMLPPSRARSAGIFVHPREVFERHGRTRPREYPHRRDTLDVTDPGEPIGIVPADDNGPLGPRWWARFRNPETEAARLDALQARRPRFARRVRALVEQLSAQGAEVTVESTVRFQERGYLMWGAFRLSRAQSSVDVEEIVADLEDAAREWDLAVPIRWRHPDGADATIRAAKAMVAAYDVVYATRRGAERSRHYTGHAVDLTAVGLPRALRLRAPDGARAVFDLSAPDQPRDLSLTPDVVAWIEDHFGLRKLEMDHPHWDDRRREPADRRRRKSGR